MKSCFFIGHRECSSNILPKLETVIEQHIDKYDIESFIVGCYGKFDFLVATALIRAKQKHPNILLLQLTPYHPAEKKLELWNGFDNLYYPFEEKKPPRKYAIVKANEQLIKECDYLIAYAWHPASNARTIVEKAKRLESKGGIKVYNLADKEI